MSNELLDFTQRDNFDFLNFSSKVKDDDDKAILKQQCERVLEFAHATVQDMCLLGWHLKELKNSKTWQEVFDPKSGVCFHNFSFQDFCEYAFGFSKTRTSNLLSLSEFVKISGTNTSGFIEERFAGYNTSQLIELSSVPSGQTHYFSPNMTVKDIRLVKKYIATEEFWYDKHRADFDLLSYAKEYAEQGQKKQSKSESSSDILPGQIGIEIPTSELASDGDEVQEEEEYKPNGGVVVTYCDLSAEDEDELMDDVYAPDEYDEEDEAYEDMQADMQTIEEESERSIAFAEPDVPPLNDVLSEEEESPKYDFSSRDKIREFLYGYKSWKKSWELVGVLEVYCHEWANGMKIYAGEYAMKGTLEQDEAKTVVRYFWKMTTHGQAFEIAKEQLWKYIATHKDEL